MNNRKDNMKKMLTVGAYVGSIVVVNWAFAVLPLLELPGARVPLATLLVGVVFVLRDYAQRAIGHRVLLAMALACGLSYWLAGPGVAMASAAAFAVAELADWAVYTFTRRPFNERVLLSSAVGVPIDSLVFLWLLPFPGVLTVGAVAWMSALKMLAALGWWRWAR